VGETVYWRLPEHLKLCMLVCGYARVYLFSVSVSSDYDQFTKVWLQVPRPLTLSHKHTLQINGQFSNNTAVQTSHSPETRWKTMFPPRLASQQLSVFIHLLALLSLRLNLKHCWLLNIKTCSSCVLLLIEEPLKYSL